MLKIIHILIFIKRIRKKILNLKLVIILEYRNTKHFLLKDILQSCLKKFVFVITKVKTTVLCTYVISYFNSEEIAGMFHEKELQKENQTESRIDKVIKKKEDKLYVIWKGYGNSF